MGEKYALLQKISCALQQISNENNSVSFHVGWRDISCSWNRFCNTPNSALNRCTLEVNAIISDILSKDERHENDDGHVSYSTVYTPVYSYNVDGQLYTTHSNTYSSNIRYRRGQTIQIFCDPDDPETFYAPNDTTNTILTVVFCGLGGLFAIIAIVLIIVLIHIKKKQKSGKNFAENELYEENNYPYDE